VGSGNLPAGIYLGGFSVDGIPQGVAQASDNEDIKRGQLLIPFHFHGEINLQCLELMCPEKSVMVVGPRGQIVNKLSTYPCQHFSLNRQELMASFSKAVMNMLASRGKSGDPIAVPSTCH
jgi:hypothetical protein